MDTRSHLRKKKVHNGLPQAPMLDPFEHDPSNDQRRRHGGGEGGQKRKRNQVEEVRHHCKAESEGRGRELEPGIRTHFSRRTRTGRAKRRRGGSHG